MKPESENQHPDEPRPPGETERDNDALRPTDPKQREKSGKGTASGESTAQETAAPQTKAKP
ncbi:MULTISPECIES: hypothetical protein [Pseudomonas]|uniref:Uncharacterized protein n=1 Tax=Pseudomonas fluorescens TaxID=294 RepID=A0A5E7B2B6_PSEFL|nr:MULTISPECIES: hypothetical protein [Pseudomonas]MBP5948377.1 hypothetical protein [Pseudomonas sp. P9(2020)]MBP5958663.1 hypothetical protein [Pseudomonas anatoliensis]MBZ9560540.1 hypothetical protein [Pseudomonas sp. P116]VVN85848.1 hypothetical protein PS718_01484 [Pseudomonas fluorescens]